MTKRKKARSGNKHKEFSNSPFNNLKGLSAFEQNPADSQKTKHKEKTESLVNNEENVSFADEMDYLGVKPLSASATTGKADEEGSLQGSVVKAEGKSDQEEFINAIGSVDVVFKDEWLLGESVNRATPRRMRQVEQGKLKPQAELDLHGLTTEDACRKVNFFLENSRHHGLDTVLVITGKGLHSGRGPVLRHAVEGFLAETKPLVVEWGVAPQRYGGDGALLVFLRNKKNKNET